jgi:hypothetical protein
MKGKPGARPIRVHRAMSITEAELCVGFLRSHGIPAAVDDAATHGTLDGIATIVEGIWITVPSDREAEAREAVAAFRAPRDDSGGE